MNKDLRIWFARSLGVGDERKAEIYLDVARSATLRDLSFWLQVLFSAGIATLGLVLNSPAVIIGAMLISPLMGPILANGLSLAAGDFVLGMRAILALIISCCLAVGFAMLLVFLLPFKEQTAEIAARSHPNTLDLVIALFSGAVGSIAICKQVKGVVTSIPGVAIAVALMPPLCVVGFGLGIAVSPSGVDGLEVARGGALLFLTNLVAITFTSMLVFLALHIDTRSVRERVRKWRAEEDQTGTWLHEMVDRLPGAERWRKVGSLPGRIILVLVIIAVIFIPLSRSLQQLRTEIAQKQIENRIRKAATELWEQQFAKLQNGEQRSYLGYLSISEQAKKLSLVLRIFTVKPVTVEERARYLTLLAQQLGRDPATINAQFIEIPTASSDLYAQVQGKHKIEEVAPAPLTVAQLRDQFAQRAESLLAAQPLPPPARLLDSIVVIGPDAGTIVRLIYLSNRDIEPDAQNVLTANLNAQFENAVIQVEFLRIDDTIGPVLFGRESAQILGPAAETLDRLGQKMTEQPRLAVEVGAGVRADEIRVVAADRTKAISDYLVSKYSVNPARISVANTPSDQAVANLNLRRFTSPQ